MNRDIANAIAGTELAGVRGLFFRHAWHGVKDLRGSTGGGRWGPEHGFPVIYLGQGVDSVIVEAYRRLVDPVEGMRGDLVGPRVLLDVEVDVDNVLDLRIDRHREAVGLDDDALSSAWGPCVRVARAAHQLGLHGIVAPAATELGITLALFEQHLPHDQLPRITGRVQWPELPPDPRTPEQRVLQIERARGAWPD
jgi:RES domain-containing protein